jgi:hypothetical protein
MDARFAASCSLRVGGVMADGLGLAADFLDFLDLEFLSLDAFDLEAFDLEAFDWAVGFLVDFDFG